METRILQCANCGAELDLQTQQCPYCTPVEAAPPAPIEPGAAPDLATPAATAPRTAPAVTDGDRALGLALFEAEEVLARGAAEKALVLASRIVKEHPESLTARALMERARRELLRGRRRERLETRVREAQELLERGNVASAERIVVSALKLIPDHPVALTLFGKLRDQRLQAGTAEAEAERELLALARTQARQSLEAARAALAAGWGRKAVLALRRGLLLVPDDPDLLALLAQAQHSLEEWDVERARRRALVAQVRAGLELLARGELDESLKILRAVLREDPDNERAQAAIQEVRRASLRGRAAPAPAPSPSPAALLELPPLPSPSEDAASAPRPIRLATPARPAAAPRATPAASPRPQPTIPPEILLSRTRRRATPFGLVLVGAALLVAVVVVLAGRSGSVPSPSRRAVTTAPETPRVETPAPPHETLPGPLSGLDPGLRGVVEATLAAYAQALEKADAALLEQARPDMTSTERERRLAPFVGALNAATDIRVVDVMLRGEEARVPILSTDVIVGREPTPPLEETLRFVRRGGVWALRRYGGDAGRPR